MKISYKKLWVLLAEKEMSKAEFRDALELSTLLRICAYFKCYIGDICDAVTA